MDRHFIRMDKMHDGSLRYASWNLEEGTPSEGVDQTKEPDLVLTGCTTDATGDWYVFSNKGDEYRVNIWQAARPSR